MEHEPFSITCETKADHILHMSYHGDCHYNSIRLVEDVSDGPAVPIDIDRIRNGYNSSINIDKSNCTSKSREGLTNIDQVLRALPWIKRPVAEFALEMSDDLVDDAIEILMSNPNLKVCP